MYAFLNESWVVFVLSCAFLVVSAWQFFLVFQTCLEIAKNKVSSEEIAGSGDDATDNGCECEGFYCNCVEPVPDDDSVNDYDCNFEEGRRGFLIFLLTVGRFSIYMGDFPLPFVSDMSRLFGIDDVELDGECLRVYEEEEEKAKRFLKKSDCKISLSIEVLRCPKWGQYLSLTAHFIDANRNLRKWVIYFKTLEDDFCYSATLRCIKDWDIGDRVCNITANSSWYIDEEMDRVKDYVQEKGKLAFGILPFGLHCCADVFRQMAEIALDAISETSVKVDEFVNMGRPCYNWFGALNGLNMALDCEAKGEWSKDDYDNHEKLSADEWKKVKAICRLLKTMSHAAQAVFEVKESTANLFLHNIQVVRASLVQESGGSDSFIRPIAEKMLAKLDKYLKEMLLVLAVASVMDPRCKMKYLEYSVSKYGGGDGFSDVTTVLATVRTIYNGYVTRSAEEEIPMDDSTSSNSDEEYSWEVKRTKPSLSDNDSSWIQEYNQNTENTRNPPKSELDWYLEDGVLPWTEDFDTLKWWRNSSPRYPVLSKMARDLLAIPMSVVTSVEAYDVVEREISARTASLRPDQMNASMCFRSWGSYIITSEI